MASSSPLDGANVRDPVEAPRLANHTATRLEALRRAAGEPDQIGAFHAHNQLPLGDPARATAARAHEMETAVKAARP